ncbi:hypothetical protein LshimejAT787_3200060 [Lyophyllum shimeji]|uniref:Uncharacterized protein n=1 Tax=Lyophyllum shimeji TaxID=47721 RepID=A0A9P3UVF0_LYOSH|nr:hypothetical protein LshimejAT787_3200060 [Lyophyllum shimeji]
MWGSCRGGEGREGLRLTPDVAGNLLRSPALLHPPLLHPVLPAHAFPSPPLPSSTTPQPTPAHRLLPVFNFIHPVPRIPVPSPLLSRTETQAVKWAEAIVAEALPQRTNIRKEDPGKLSQVGYNAGKLNRPAFHWAKNLTGRKRDVTAVAQMDVKCSSVFALLWQMVRSRLPKEVINDFDTFLTQLGIRRMDGSGQMASEGSSGTYSVVLGDATFDFHNVELAPPAGIFGQNYSRGIHFEYQPHLFGLAWTLSCNKGPDAGGNFFMAKYGLRIEAAANALVFWMPREWHGTSLLDHSPYDAAPDFIQRGAAIVTPNRIVS